MATSTINHIIIIGSGSAGWLSAGLIAAQSHLTHNAKVTLIESPNVPTLGVGEGTWPTMRQTLKTIGISETQFMRECDASFKQGSRFDGWCHDSHKGKNNEYYYHPFSLPVGYQNLNIAPYWFSQHQTVSFSHAVSSQTYLCDHNKAPKTHLHSDYQSQANYGYHLDAGKFAQLLNRHSVDKLNVNHVIAHVDDVINDEDGYISAVKTREHGIITGDLFIDCSGHHGCLIDKHYQIPLLTQDHILFNDRAVAVQVPYANDQQEIVSYTKATAQDTGWIWDIGLQTRRGVGMVYSSKFESTQGAKDKLISYLKTTQSDLDTSELTIRELKFTPGYREQFWHKNCIAIGMSAGFIEPLEASALVMVELGLNNLLANFPTHRNALPELAKRFNLQCHYRWQRIIDFLKLHYVLSTRTSKYWQAHRAQSATPQSLLANLALWQYQSPWLNDFDRSQEVFSAASYQYILYGMKHLPQFPEMKMPAGVIKHFTNNQQDAKHTLAKLPTNRQLLNHIQKFGLQPI
ncbi:tryptophan halogenase family protein [Pseudoalteromonas arctica]|uniref:Tryptophan 7-halogenase n=1 Tax=Pseudoalteromonas arctica TaxID=394751 RepID=A0A7Y0DR00_9GAMM|nr:tryptophan halogenase family protein [Pseudoalteromonas arctica]NMM40004.1 tryptophan 7-halogenase [Pseudoalteromonas arctica]